ncbi:DUF5655 domain-containing protein [Microbacterium elymi]|uniref:DUF5655 domain-containing protein n=1 Tax=Microbacterium elymi TaxID=2909587 RepID=A0ABY5NHQ3_9MICO|nr:MULTISPECIES: DUF5655 domain-containing protein [Microbacterium]UUT34659.1 DUF5655 domain-containing protein [Microbacterium elymi]
MTDAADAEWTVARHLADKPDFAIALYHRFIEMVEAVGPFTYAVSKSTITLKGKRRGFAGAHPVQSGLRGYFDLQRVVSDARISSSAPFSNRLFVHYFRIESADQLDHRFAEWLREAYAVGNGAHIR